MLMGLVLVPHSKGATGKLTHFCLFRRNDLIRTKRVDILVEDLASEMGRLSAELQFERICRIADWCNDKPVWIA